MKKITLSAIIAATGLVLSASAMAQTMAKADYKAAKDKIEADYKAAKAGCAPLVANAKDICKADAKGKKNVALADLDATNKPSPKARYDLRLARADADYAVANEKCDDLAGNGKDVCRKEAKAVRISAKADAKLKLETGDANRTANEKTAIVQDKANRQINEANNDAATAKRNAEYAVAKEKCDAFAGAAKDSCMNDAKARYGK